MFAALGQALVSTRRELLGDPDGAERAQIAKWRFFKDSLGGPPDGRAIDATNVLARLCCEDGRWEDARRWLAVYAELPHRGDSYRESPGTRMVVEAQLALHAGEPDLASALARRAADRSELSTT